VGRRQEAVGRRQLAGGRRQFNNLTMKQLNDN